MKCLFLDLASHEGLLACVAENEVLSSQPLHPRIGDHELLPAIEAVLKDAGWSFKDLDQIACVIGPGGFTSLRMAVTLANVLADQLKIPSSGIHLSDLYRARAKTDAYWFHSTKKDQLFVQGGKWKEPTLIPLTEMPQGAWMGELIPEHRERIGNDPIQLQPYTEALPAFLKKSTFETTPLIPWYGRGW